MKIRDERFCFAFCRQVAVLLGVAAFLRPHLQFRWGCAVGGSAFAHFSGDTDAGEKRGAFPRCVSSRCASFSAH